MSYATFNPSVSEPNPTTTGGYVIRSLQYRIAGVQELVTRLVAEMQMMGRELSALRRPTLSPGADALAEVAFMRAMQDFQRRRDALLDRINDLKRQIEGANDRIKKLQGDIDRAMAEQQESLLGRARRDDLERLQRALRAQRERMERAARELSGHMADLGRAACHRVLGIDDQPGGLPVSMDLWCGPGTLEPSATAAEVLPDAWILQQVPGLLDHPAFNPQARLDRMSEYLQQDAHIGNPLAWQAAANSLDVSFATLTRHVFDGVEGLDEAVSTLGHRYAGFVGTPLPAKVREDFGARLVTAFLVQDRVGFELPSFNYFATSGPWNETVEPDLAALEAAVEASTDIGTGGYRWWVPPVIAEHGNGSVSREVLNSDPASLGFAPLAGQPGHFLAVPAARQWHAMVAAAAADGVTIDINEASLLSYRSLQEQHRLWNNSPRPLSERSKWVARPGGSFHGTGLTVDLRPDDRSNNPEYRTTYHWLEANAGRFGFHQPMAHEPWHWEFHPGDASAFARPLSLGAQPVASA